MTLLDCIFLFKVVSLPPPGALATVGALSFGILQFKRGNLAKSQLAMRMRVVAQGGTVIALVLGGLLSSSGTTTKKHQT